MAHVLNSVAVHFKSAEQQGDKRDKVPLTARCSGGKDSLHGAEKKALLLGQVYVCPNSLWAPFATTIAQLMYCLVLCSGFAGMLQNIFNFFCPTKIYMLKPPLILMPTILDSDV